MNTRLLVGVVTAGFIVGHFVGQIGKSNPDWETALERTLFSALLGGAIILTDAITQKMKSETSEATTEE